MYDQISKNQRNTRILLMLFVFFITLVAYVFGLGLTGSDQAAIGVMGIAGIIAMIYALISYFNSGKITLAISKAKEIKKADNPMLHNVVENLCIASGLPTPKIYLIEDTALNAFATGRSPEHAYVAVTSGLLDKLEKPELEGVIAHELSHIKNYDIRLQSVTVALIGMIALLSDIFLRSLYYGGRSRGNSRNKGNAIIILIGVALAILSPLIARLIHLAISRQREYLADSSGAMLTRYPEGLARALEKIAADTEPLEAANKATAHLYIENPLRNEKGMKWLNGLYNTHPPVEERIKKLRESGQ